MTYDVYVYAPDAGGQQWFLLAAGVEREAADVLESGLVWPASVVEAADEAREIASVPAPQPADRCLVWMRYPVVNGKVPWGLIARDVQPDQVPVWSKNITQKLSIQPAKPPLATTSPGDAQ